MSWTEMRFWSPVLGGPAARISMPDAHGAEYFAIMPAGYGKAYREARERALDAIEDAIEAGALPGEVRL